ncbi:MAG: glucose-1-phosphate cytidylyltransferase [bacterium]|nr:glucose-1-phosphate cytidylyltransferase [bacterium]
MKVVILCGGKGTRLREETEYKPKPMVEIGNRPILWHIMKLYAHYGFNDFILCLGYKGDVIKNFFLNYQRLENDVTIDLSTGKTEYHNRHDENWKVTMVDTGPETPKGGRIKMVEKYIDGDEFFLTYGDGVSDVDIGVLLNFHREQGKAVTFTGVHPVSRFATVELTSDGRLMNWKEKRKIEEYINGGFFVVRKSVLTDLSYNQEFEEEPMERLTAGGQVSMYQHEGFWHCMDTFRDFQHLNALWNKGQAPWAVWSS